MIISYNSQLGLSYWDKSIMLDYLSDTQKCLEIFKADVEDMNEDDLKWEFNNGDALLSEINSTLGYKPELKGSEFYTVKHPKPNFFLIQNGVEVCAEMIKISENFSCSIFNSIKDGEYFYLLGKYEFFRFLKFRNVIRGTFWNRERHVSFEIGFHL